MERQSIQADYPGWHEALSEIETGLINKLNKRISMLQNKIKLLEKSINELRNKKQSTSRYGLRTSTVDMTDKMLSDFEKRKNDAIIELNETRDHVISSKNYMASTEYDKYVNDINKLSDDLDQMLSSLNIGMGGYKKRIKVSKKRVSKKKSSRKQKKRSSKKKTSMKRRK